MMQMDRLSEHFTYEEGIFSETAVRWALDNTPTPGELANMRVAAKGMEAVRMLLNVSIHVSSWLRKPAVNAKVNGSATSGHMLGWCIDFTAPRFGTPLQIVQAIVASTIKFDQCIQEGTWVHISFDPRMRGQILTAHFIRNAAGEVIRTEYSKGIR